MIPNLSKEMIDVMQQLRKRLRSEFNSDIKLSQPDVVHEILKLVNKSKDQKTQLLFADLEDLMGIELRTPVQEKENTTMKTTTRVYRGQVIEDIQPVVQSSSTARVYRGHAVT